jgi:ferric-dicitrate binding protein FerR (iron transport regulator)
MAHQDLYPDLDEALAELPPEQRRRLARIWAQLGHRATRELPLGAPPADMAWEQLRHRLLHTNHRLRHTDHRRYDRGPAPPRSRIGLLGLALAALLAVAVGAGWWLHLPVAQTTGTGETLHVTLADGTELLVAADSRVEYARGFRAFPFRAAERRSVALRGEAFFRVAHGHRPFEVRTHNAVVEVMGTSFNVRARDDEAAPRTLVEVESGQVRVHGLTPESGQVSLSAGQIASVEPRGLAPVASTQQERIAVWRHGGFAIHHLPLTDVARELERRFGVTVRLHDDIPPDLPLTLFYQRAADAETIIHDIALAADVRYRVLHGGFELLPARSR